MSMAPRVFSDHRSLGHALAQRIMGGIAEAGRAHRPYLLGCPGGRSLLPAYRMLNEVATRHRLDLSPLVIVMMDDYVTERNGRLVHVPADAHYSCQRFAVEQIVAPIRDLTGAPGPDRIWMPDPADPSVYDRLIARSGGIDLFLLASGASDGHIAFNPPGSSRHSTTRVVELSERTRVDNLATFPRFKSLDEVPTHGVTVGVGTIADLSRSSVMVCLGAEKRRTVKMITSAQSYDPTWPATIVTEMSQAELWVDRAVLNQVP